MQNLRIRCSALGKIMGEPRKKTDILTQTKTYIESLVKQEIYDYKVEITSKYFDKGNMCEQDSIDLYNSVFFTNHKKNTVRLFNEFIEGECDIIAPNEIIDIKTPWSKETFPALPDDGINKDYEWQLRGYMWLYNKDNAALAYCLVDTPDSLIEWENNLSIHHVSEIAPELRITLLKFERDTKIEKQIEIKVNQCRDYAQEY